MSQDANRDLTADEVQALPLDLRCCFYIEPWNTGWTGATVEQWAADVGWLAYVGLLASCECEEAVRLALTEAQRLIVFVKEICPCRPASA